MSGADKTADAGRKPERDPDKSAVKTDGSLGDAEIKPLKRPVNSDGFLIDRPLSPEEEGLAGPLPKGEEKEPPKPDE